MDINGARWSTHGAEAVLKLRAVGTNGDFDTYWHHHLDKERDRVHATRDANRHPTRGIVTPRAAPI